MPASLTVSVEYFSKPPYWHLKSFLVSLGFSGLHTHTHKQKEWERSIRMGWYCLCSEWQICWKINQLALEKSSRSYPKILLLISATHGKISHNGDFSPLTPKDTHFIQSLLIAGGCNFTWASDCCCMCLYGMFPVAASAKTKGLYGENCRNSRDMRERRNHRRFLR